MNRNYQYGTGSGSLSRANARPKRDALLRIPSASAQRLARAHGASGTSAGTHFTGSESTATAGFSAATAGPNPVVISYEEAVNLRAQLGHYAEYWDDPAMDAYDAL